MSSALRVLPPKLELKRRNGSGMLAPRANVSFTTFVYASPVQTIPWWDQTGLLHFHSSIISGSASRISARMRARVSPRHPPRSRIRRSMSGEAGFPVAPVFVGDLDLVADLRGLLARDVPLAFGSLLFDFDATVYSPTCCDAQVTLPSGLVGFNFMLGIRASESALQLPLAAPDASISYDAARRNNGSTWSIFRITSSRSAAVLP